MKKRIVFTVINDLVFDQRMQRICSTLQNSGYSVVLIGRILRHSKPLNLKLPYRQIRIKCFFNQGKLFYVEYNIRLFFRLLFIKTDIICSIDLDTILPGLSIARLRRKKFGYDAHEYFTEVPELQGRPIVKKIWEIIANFCIPESDFRYTVSDSLAKELELRYNKKFEVIRNVPLLKKQVNLKAEYTIIYQGAVNQGRGLELLMEAVKLLDINVVIAGDGDISGKIRDKIQQLNLQEKALLTGMLRPEILEEITHKAMIGYNLLENCSRSYYHSLSNKFFSYIHACIPSISNRFPNYEAINSQYNISILCDYNLDSLVNAIKKLLEDKELYAQLKTNCLKARQELCWQNEEIALLRIYNEI